MLFGCIYRMRWVSNTSREGKLLQLPQYNLLSHSTNLSQPSDRNVLKLLEIGDERSKKKSMRKTFFFLLSYFFLLSRARVSLRRKGPHNGNCRSNHVMYYLGMFAFFGDSIGLPDSYSAQHYSLWARSLLSLTHSLTLCVARVFFCESARKHAW